MFIWNARVHVNKHITTFMVLTKMYKKITTTGAENNKYKEEKITLKDHKKKITEN